MQNKIDAAITVADRDQIITHINQISALLPFLINLTPEERLNDKFFIYETASTNRR